MLCVYVCVYVVCGVLMKNQLTIIPLSLSLSLSSKLCMEEMTCFEPEACCQLISGMDFHKFYFEKCNL